MNAQQQIKKMPELGVIPLLRNGDEKTFELVFRKYYESLCHYAYMLLQDNDLSEDVVQKVFVNLWEKRANLKVEVSLKSYLYKSVYNNSMNEIKHQKVVQNHKKDLNTNDLLVEPVGQVTTKELEKSIEKALLALPEQCRLIFKMSRFEELKYKEIASVLGVSPKTVENQMGKALRLMRENLSEFLTIWILLINFLTL